jgi:Xaa-Pro aminopeptidase
MEYMETPLHAGMTVTDEPGLYLDGKFGVRIENTLVIKGYKETEFGKFLQMEPLTLCPIDMEPVDFDILLPEEILWINRYHQHVYDKLSPYLSEDEKQWLKTATKEVNF